jgi:hypothetical protein
MTPQPSTPAALYCSYMEDIKARPARGRFRGGRRWLEVLQQPVDAFSIRANFHVEGRTVESGHDDGSAHSVFQHFFRRTEAIEEAIQRDEHRAHGEHVGGG